VYVRKVCKKCSLTEKTYENNLLDYSFFVVAVYSKRGAGAKSKLSLFDDVEDSEDLFSTVSSSTTKKTVAAPVAPVSNYAYVLFYIFI